MYKRQTDIPLVINGIDTDAPTANIEVSEVMSGDRKDSKAVVNINDAKEDEVQFAFIPESEYSSAMSDGKIKDSYLESYDNSIINVSQTSSVDAKWENEKNLTYTVNICLLYTSTKKKRKRKLWKSVLSVIVTTDSETQGLRNLVSIVV